MIYINNNNDVAEMFPPSVLMVNSFILEKNNHIVKILYLLYILFLYTPLARNTVFGGSTRSDTIQALPVKEDGQRLEISDLDIRQIIQSRRRTTRALIRLGGCAG